MEAEKGIKGEMFELELELKLLAQVGLVGLPNVGKSTLLSVISKAKPKIADYEFTTLEPNLGVMEAKKGRKRVSILVADIPGLIEGAHEGKGLGDKFLKHVERTKVLVHVVAPRFIKGGEKLEESNLEESLWKNYRTIRKELESYGKILKKKKEVVVLNKIDILEDKQMEAILRYFSKKGVEVLPISGATGEGIDEFKKKLVLLF